MRVALLGTGLMGAPMARRLLAAGHALRAWNRTRAKAQPLLALGAAVADSPADAVNGAEATLVILENGAVVREVLFVRGTAEALAAGSFLVDLSSIPPDEAREHHRRLAERGVAALDAPVSGGPPAAEAGALAIMVGCETAAFDRAEPLLRALGSPVHVGPPGAGQFVKLTNQMITSAALSAVAEAMLMARVEGIDPVKLCEALQGGLADSKVLQVHGRRMAARDFAARGHVHTFVKDLKTSRAIAEARGLDLPVTRLAFEILDRLNGGPAAQEDIAAIARAVEERNPPHRIGG
jgi:2-hydroxy-3-oxopropionate reductase